MFRLLTNTTNYRLTAGDIACDGGHFVDRPLVLGRASISGFHAAVEADQQIPRPYWQVAG
jgi:hypothetical protein